MTTQNGGVHGEEPAPRSGATAADGEQRTTRLRILRAAEALFAERGIDGVALREIGRAAGQRNNSATHYHFGSKEALVSAILVHRMTPLAQRREELLTEAASGGGPDIEGIVRAWVFPSTEHLDDPEYRFTAQFLVNVLLAPRWLRLAVESVALTGPADRIRLLLVPLLAARCGYGEAEAQRRFNLARSLHLHAIADRQRFLSAGLTSVETDGAAFTSSLIDAILGLLLAPCSSDRVAAGGRAPAMTAAVPGAGGGR